MKHYARYLACAAILSAALTFAGAKQLFSLAITALKEPLKAGDELHLRVTITNISGRDISFIVSPGPIPEDGPLYQINARDAEGRPAPPSASVLRRDKRVPIYYGSRLARTVKPGESFVDQVDVTRLYDLSQPGKYTISVARSIPPHQNLGEGLVESNTVTVTVVQ